MEATSSIASQRLSAERRIATLCGATAVLLGLAGAAGWGLGIPVFIRIALRYKAIAPSVAVALITMGLILPRLAARRVGRRERVRLAIPIGFFSLVGLLEWVGFVVGADLNREDALTAYLARAWAIPFESMSPVAGALLLLVGAAMLALLFGPGADRGRRDLGDAAGIVGTVAAGAALVFGLGYLYGAPLLYGGPAIAISATGALGGLLLAVGAVAAAGRDHLPLRAVVGDSARARLLRSFVPLTVLAALTASVVGHRLPTVGDPTRVLVVSGLGVLFAGLAGWVAARVARSVGGAIDQARLAQQHAEDELRKARDYLEIRVAERTADLERAHRAFREEAAERQRAEEAVRAERQRLNDVLETLPAYVVLLTPDHHVSFANRFFRERFGESHGRRCFEYLFGRSEPCETCETYNCLKTMAPHRWEWTAPDGRNYDIYDFPFTDTDGSSLILEMGIDITELKRAEEELRRHQEHLEDLVEARTADLERSTAQLLAAERARSEVLATLNREISHRVKNNLSMVAGMLQMQIAGERDPRLAEMLQAAIARLYAFASVHDQLTVTGSGEVDLTAAIRHCAEATRRAFPRSSVAVSVEGEVLRYPSSAAVHLSVVANELITNGLKYGAPGSDGELRIDVRVARADGAVTMSVWNSGNPVPAGLDLSQQTGLGLSLVQSLVVGQYGGTFMLEPQGGGTLARVLLSEQRLQER